MKKIVSLCLSVVLSVCCISTTNVFAATYDIEAAMQYAESHWNDGQGLCAEFVSKCVQAGGINISTQAGTGGCWKAICKKTGLDMYDLTLSSEGNALYLDNSSILQKGDVVVQWCYTHSISPHIMICGGYNSNGYATFYAHNNAMNNTTYNLKRNTAYQHRQKAILENSQERLYSEKSYCCCIDNSIKTQYERGERVAWQSRIRFHPEQ